MASRMKIRWFPSPRSSFLPASIPGMPRIDQAKRALLAAALAEHGGSVTAASHMIGISVPTGYAWKKRFGL
jgi:transcriptional regulator of acetoin/glycerol metabolism